MRTRRHRRAFTLIEAVAAIVVLSVALPGMLWAIKDAQHRRADPVLMNRARWLAAEKLEDILADRASPTRGYSYIAASKYAAETTITGFPGFTRSVSITETGVALTGAGTGYKVVQVTVGWRDGRNRARTLAASTVVTQYAPPGFPP